MAEEVPVLEPGMKVKWSGAPGVFTIIAGPSAYGAYVVEDQAGNWHIARGVDLTPVPDMATFSLDLGDGRCGSVEVPVADVEWMHERTADAVAGRVLLGLVRDVVQGKGED